MEAVAELVVMVANLVVLVAMEHPHQLVVLLPAMQGAAAAAVQAVDLPD